MPKFLIGGIVFLLLLGAGYGLAQAARAIPWDCADWQAFAHADRTTAILESLAENRGKTLYCGIDQSDTFTKAETWAAGRDRNERDDTVYFGERGQFRGFIAAQEGWLTDGESGITGVSIDRIFEFPREQGKRRKQVVRRSVDSATDGLEGVSSCGLDIDLSTTACADSGLGNTQAAARTSYFRADPSTGGYAVIPDWAALTAAVARDYCRREGFTRATNVESVDPGITEVNEQATSPVWQYATRNSMTVAYQVRAWSATCVKVKRRARR